ncbi:hypothetical protein [Mesorhizobium japonicum]|uniref:Uncharacterized protein n=1 Tax=Rhizobium loti TaxID=381 RepID=A0A1A5HNQ4_RHILI|nr:hypothetical protein BAE42_23930 [Mesorhizobium loti]OBP70538.1 hypothetical protein BAE39_23370 [Mesorhizobium loti]OBP84662.1 hypothetical protein BAE38_24770 [Mesorhizobium loti]OBP87155.1 hypothetical protein BAE41_26165 [Mesorhizobium loti]OBP88906.1 hypothetical protein BAE40_20565 [Mesorhizobium loti]
MAGLSRLLPGGPWPRRASRFYTFGHGHLGLTLSAVTARLVGDLIAGRRPNSERLAPFAAGRF